MSAARVRAALHAAVTPRPARATRFGRSTIRARCAGATSGHTSCARAPSNPHGRSIMQHARSLLMAAALAASAAPLTPQPRGGDGAAAAARRLVLDQARRMADHTLVSLSSDGLDACDLVAEIA